MLDRGGRALVGAGAERAFAGEREQAGHLAQAPRDGRAGRWSRVHVHIIAPSKSCADTVGTTGSSCFRMRQIAPEARVQV